MPRCLYPDTKAKSRVQRLTVPSCSECNRGWSNDEAHFRNVLLVAGEPNEPVRELWTTTALRSFDEIDGQRRLQDLVEQMVPVRIAGEDRWMIYPAHDSRVMRIIRKIIRGLSHHHRIETALPEIRITAEVMRYKIPEGLEEELHFHHREADIIEYWYNVYEDGPTTSSWLLRFFERRVFVAWVSRD